ncbi:putative pre-rRNA-processing protein Ipi1 [Helianthus annuus]|nr:putative pre-rRNA-processing protein Ipi1 [Helianthus annuus]
MVKHKAQLKKRGVDFKKIKRKIGKKLRPPKNTTNTELKSKAIILPEQSLASEKAGLAVSKRGLTLKELLQQTSHHNAKVRRDALVGIRDIFLNHPSELKMHKLRVIEKLRERMSDEDKVVRETLYQLLKTVIFPACKEGNQGTFISLMMAYVFNAMTHLTIDVRLMAFKTFDLVVQHYPVSFSMFAEKVHVVIRLWTFMLSFVVHLQNSVYSYVLIYLPKSFFNLQIIQHYKEILQKNQFNLHDKGKLKSVLAGLAYCLSLLPCNTTDNNSSTDNAVADRRILHAFESETHKDHSGFSSTEKELKGLLPILISGIQDFMPSCLAMETQSYDCVLSILKSIDLVVKFFVNGKGRSAKQLKVSLPSNGSDQVVLQKLLKKLFVLFPLNPTHQSSEKVENRLFKLNVIVSEIFFCLYDWSAPPSVFLDKFLVFIIDALSEKAFTEVFKKCDPESSMKLVCLSAVEEMLFLVSSFTYISVFTINHCFFFLNYFLVSDLQKTSWVSPNTSDSEIIDFQISWIREIPLLLTLLGDKNPLATKDVLRLQLHLAQCGTHSQELDNMQYTLREFYSTCPCDGDISYGPFMKLGREIQELSVCCLYYFSFMDPSLLQSVAGCCLCEYFNNMMRN